MSPRPRHFTAEMGILRMLLVLFTSFLYTPLTSALGTGHMSYPDGSECWACFADDFSCVTHMYGPGFISTCPISATACGGAQVPDGYVQTPLDGDFRVCASLNGCVHDCVTSVGLNYLVETCCFKEGSQYIRDFYINGLDQSQLSPLNQPAPSSTIIPKAPQGTSGPSSTTSSEPQVIEGKGVGISCSLVQSASAAYNSAISAAAAGGSASSSTLLSYYSQALHIACLRSSPLCKVQECVEVEATLKAAPTGCKEGGDEHLGSDFEEEIFAGLIQGSGFGDIQGRQAKVDSAIQDLVGKVNGGDVGSPFLNLMLGIGADGDNAPDTAKLVEGYYGTVQVFDDMQPLFEKYIQSKLGGLESDNLSALMKTVDDLARSHSQLLKCGVAPSFGGQAEPNTNSNTAGTSLQTNGTLPAAAAAAASLFVPFVAAQLRNDKIIQALLPPRTPDSNKNATGIDIAALSKLLNARLPISPTLQVDTRNWLYPSLKPGDSSNGNPNSEAFSLLEQALIKQELSNEAGSDFEITTELHAIMDLVISSRTNKKLSDFMATMAMFFPTTNGTQAYKPTRITAAGKIYPVIGPVGVIFPAATELIPGYSASTNITSVDTSSTGKNGFAAGAGGALTPVAPTDADIASVLYSTATLRMHIDPAHYVDAKPKITNPGAQFYILDLVSGKEIPSKYSVQSTGGEDREGNPMEFGVLEATIEYGSGIWAGGWGGGGAFAVAVRDWVEAQSGAVERWSWERNSWGIVMVVGWTAAVVYLAGVVV